MERVGRESRFQTLSWMILNYFLLHLEITVGMLPLRLRVLVDAMEITARR